MMLVELVNFSNCNGFHLFVTPNELKYLMGCIADNGIDSS